MKNKIDLTATEMGYLWSTYQAETLNVCLLTYFDAIVEDPEIKQINTLSLQTATEKVEKLKEIFRNSHFPIPIGFTEADVSVQAERLYTDPFILYFQWFIGKGNLNFGSLAINTIAREDIFIFYENLMNNSLTLLKKSRELLLNKGLWIRAPYIPAPTEITYVKNDHFLGSLFTGQRPIAGIEVASVFYNLITNTLGLSLINSFIQVTKKGEIHDYFVRGKEIAQKHLKIMSKILDEEGLPIPNTWNAGVTAATEPPFSEKLMLFLINFLNAQGVSNYGNAVANSMRKDIGLDFSRLSSEVSLYGEDGVKLTIKNGWMEEPPTNVKQHVE